MEKTLFERSSTRGLYISDNAPESGTFVNIDALLDGIEKLRTSEKVNGTTSININPFTAAYNEALADVRTLITDHPEEEKRLMVEYSPYELQDIHIQHEDVQLTSKERREMINHIDLIRLAAHINDGWEPDLNNEEDCVWHVYFNIAAGDLSPIGLGNMKNNDCVFPNQEKAELFITEIKRLGLSYLGVQNG